MLNQTSNNRNYEHNFEDSHTLLHDPYSASSATNRQPYSQRFASHFRRANPLFWPLVAFTLLMVLFFILTIVGFSRSGSGSGGGGDGGHYQSSVSRLIGDPLLLPDDGQSYQHFTILQLNDVYELLPLGDRGGLARASYINKLLTSENANKLSILAGDVLSPSALSVAEYFNGTATVPLSGIQMVEAFNAFGLDYAAYGNHELDLDDAVLRDRINRSRFQWMSANVFTNASNRETRYPNDIQNPGYVRRTVNGVRLLLIGVTIDSNKGSRYYVDIPDVVGSIAIVKGIVAQGNYDVAIAITHWDLSSDQTLAESVPELSLICGGHEHANYYITRGSNFIPITKADSNDATVYIHRFAYAPATKNLVMSHHIQIIDQSVPSDDTVGSVATQWWDVGMAGFERSGYQPNEVVTVLPDGVEWDGRSEVVRTQRNNLLTQQVCQSLLILRDPSDSTIVPLAAVHNTGSVRIDDVLTGAVTQYDVLRVLPFSNRVTLLSVTGASLLKSLSNPTNVPGNGGFLSYCGAIGWTSTGGYQWNNAPLNSSDTSAYTIATTDYLSPANASDPISPGGAGKIFDGERLYTGTFAAKQFILYLNPPPVPGQAATLSD